MTTHRDLSPDAHAYLDGDREACADPRERRAAERLARAAAVYPEQVGVPGPALDRAVMAAIAAKEGSDRRGFWRWFFAPIDVRIRPATGLAAAAALSVVLLISIGQLRSGDAGVVTTQPGTVLVQFELRAPAARSVSLAGSFNAWSSDAVPLVPSTDPGVWTVTVPLPPGEHEYLFVIDGEEWVPDPRAHAQIDDGFGQSNSVITVGPRGVARS